MPVDTPAAHPGISPDVFRALSLLLSLGLWRREPHPEETAEANQACRIEENMKRFLDELTEGLIGGIVHGFLAKIPGGESVGEFLHCGDDFFGEMD